MRAQLRVRFILGGALVIILASVAGAELHSAVMARGVSAPWDFVLGLGAFLPMLLVPLWLMLNRWIFRPLGQMERSNRLVARRNLEAAIIPEEKIRKDEIGALMHSRNTMLHALLDQQRQLQEEKEQAEMLNRALLSATAGETERGLKELLEHLCRHLGLEGGWVLALGDEDRVVRVVASHNLSASIRGREAEFFALPCRCLEMLQREPEEVAISVQVCQRFLGLGETREVLVVPLIAEGRVLGVLDLLVPEGFRLSEASRVFLESIAGAISLVLCRAQAEAALQKSEEKYRNLFEYASDAVFIVDPSSHRFLDVNEKAVEQTGYAREELFEFAIKDLDEHCDASSIEESLKKGSAVFEANHRRKDGAVIPVEISSRLIDYGGRQALQAFVRDIGERKRLEEQLRQSQKMEAVGRLAGGVAHDFNNLITVIMGYCTLLQGALERGDPRRADVDEITKAGERAANLTRQLLAFSRRQVLQPEVLDVNEVVASVERMLRRVIGEDIEFVTVLDPALGRVKADRGQLEQVLMNLAVNARDAMPGGGVLTVKTANVELDEEYARRHVPTRPGSYVMLAVSDTGVGMDAETRSHIFEPFFTTKAPGEGTGLGLATVYGIVKQSDGYIWAYSEPGHGSTFRIYVPRVEKAGEPARPVQVYTIPAGGKETILLVEDERMVRELARRVLIEHGYTVLVARNGEEALEICERQAAPIHLLLTDMVMPRMSGRELAERAVSQRRDMKVLYMSGYLGRAIVPHGALEAGTPFLPKPFTPGTLARKVRDVLDAPERGHA